MTRAIFPEAPSRAFGVAVLRFFVPATRRHMAATVRNCRRCCAHNFKTRLGLNEWARVAAYVSAGISLESARWFVSQRKVVTQDSRVASSRVGR